ncbi:MAG: hypothetical protein AAF582_05465 [Pseudomonadota bacterium]
MNRGHRYFLLALSAAFVMPAGLARAAPGDVLFSDTFDAGTGCGTLAPFWTASDATLAGVSTQTAQSGSCSAFTRGSAVTVTGPVIDLSSAIGATLTAWLRQGDDSFSEDVDAGEDFVFEYLSASGAWTALTVLQGAGADGEVTNISLDLPAGALHAGFQLRFRQTGGSGGPPANGGIGYDYWHIDDVQLIETGTAPPIELPSGLGIGLCERFENGFGNWNATNSARAGVNADTFQSASNAMFLRHASVTSTSIAFDSNELGEIRVWIRRGADTFSENPDAGENLTLQYLSAANAWVTLETFPGSGPQGEIFDRTYTVPDSAWHSNFQVRFTLASGSGSDFDYWHIDDLCFDRATPDFSVAKTVEIEHDPINQASDPRSIPGAWAIYTITVTNHGRGSADLGTVAIGDVVDGQTSLFTGDFDGFGRPFEFTDGSGANRSGLSLVYGGLNDATDGVTFLNGGGVAITPNGSFDPSVDRFELQFQGAMNGAVAGATPSFAIRYRVQVE